MPAAALRWGTRLPSCGKLGYQESFASYSQLPLGKAAFWRNSPSLAGCRRLRRAAPSQCSCCSSSPLPGASPHPAREQSLAALLPGQRLLGCSTSPPNCRKALCKAATPSSALPSQPHPTPKALLAECLLAPEKASPRGLLLIGGFLLFLFMSLCFTF